MWTDTQTGTHLLLHGFAVEHHPAKQSLDVIQLGIWRSLHHGLQHVLLQVQSICLVLGKVGGHNVVGAQLDPATDGLLLTHDKAQQGALATAIGPCSNTWVSGCEAVWTGNMCVPWVGWGGLGGAVSPMGWEDQEVRIGW